MTRGDIKGYAALEAQDFQRGNDSREDPYSMDRWVDEAVQDICRITHHAYLTLSMAVTAGQATYCFSPADLLYVESIDLTLADGTVRHLSITNTADVAVSAPAWRVETPVVDQTNTAVFNGGANFTLYPTPNYSLAGAIVMRGFGVIHNGSWTNDTDECPLPPRTHDTIVHFVAWKLAERIRNFDQARNSQRDYLRGKGLFESEMNTLTESHKHRFPVANTGRYGWNPLGYDPLSN